MPREGSGELALFTEVMLTELDSELVLFSVDLELDSELEVDRGLPILGFLSVVLMTGLMNEGLGSSLLMDFKIGLLIPTVIFGTSTTRALVLVVPSVGVRRVFVAPDFAVRSLGAVFVSTFLVVRSAGGRGGGLPIVTLTSLDALAVVTSCW